MIKKVRYHEPTSCNNCGGENNIIWEAIENGFLSEGRTNCKDCGHLDLWSYGFFASSDTIVSKCKTYTV